MKKNSLRKINNKNVTVLLLVIASFALGYFTNTFFAQKFSGSRNLVPNNGRILSVDWPDVAIPGGAISYLNMKWLDNLKFAKKEVVQKAEVNTLATGEIVLVSFTPGLLNVDKTNKINYPYQIAMRIKSPNGELNTLFFSKYRVQVAKIFRTKNGIKQQIAWTDLRVGDKITVEEAVNLLIPNADKNNNFTDQFVKSLTINVL